MRKEIVEKLFETMYPNFTIKSIEILETNKLENGEWVRDLPAVFVNVCYKEESDRYENVTNTLTLLTGHEFAVSLV